MKIKLLNDDRHFGSQRLCDYALNRISDPRTGLLAATAERHERYTLDLDEITEAIGQTPSTPAPDGRH